jgi:predicted nucleic acid-binding protein
MATGIDTSLLVAAEVTSHPDHTRARAKLQSLVQAGEQLALAPSVSQNALPQRLGNEMLPRPCTSDI